jgi:hypothetical protein
LRVFKGFLFRIPGLKTSHSERKGRLTGPPSHWELTSARSCLSIVISQLADRLNIPIESVPHRQHRPRLRLPTGKKAIHSSTLSLWSVTKREEAANVLSAFLLVCNKASLEKRFANLRDTPTF